MPNELGDGLLSDELVGVISGCLALLGEPSRMRILDRLRFGERNVQSIADELLTTQQNVSGHLRLLHGAGVVSRRIEGREAYYSVVDASVFDVWTSATIVRSRTMIGGG